MGKSSTPPQQTTTSQVQLPAWVEAASQGALSQAQNVSANLMTPYTGQRVADMTPQQLSAIQGMQGAVGMAQPAYNLAQLSTAQGLDFQPGNIRAGNIAGNMGQFFSPYIGSVINPSLNILDQQRQQALSGIGAQAAQSNAFGGSRQGVQEGVTNAQYGLQGAQLAGNLYNQAYNTALGAGQTQAQMQQTAQTQNIANQLAAQQQRLAAASQLGQLGGAGQQAYLQSLGAGLAGGNQLQAQQQAQLDAAQQYYQQLQQYPLQQLQTNLSALGAIPYGQTTQTTGPANYMQGSPLMGAAGGALAGAQLGSMFMPGIGTALGAGVGGLAGLFGTPR